MKGTLLLLLALGVLTRSAASAGGTGDVTFSASATRTVAVWFGNGMAPPVASEAQMRNVNRAFVPDLLVVPAGSTVRFPNDDSFYHSIYSTDSSDPFDIGYYDNGPGKTVTFTHTGVVNVRCHIHATMHGMIVVAGGPYTTPQNGTVRLGLPRGTYTMHAILDDGKDVTRKIVLRADLSTTLP